MKQYDEVQAAIKKGKDESEKRLKMAVFEQGRHERDGGQEEVGQVATNKVDSESNDRIFILDLIELVKRHGLNIDCNMESFSLGIFMYKCVQSLREAGLNDKMFNKFSAKEEDAKLDAEFFKTQKIADASK